MNKIIAIAINLVCLGFFLFFIIIDNTVVIRVVIAMLIIKETLDAIISILKGKD